MDARQYALAMRYLMRQATWSAGTQELVMGNRVFAVADGIEEEQIPDPPFALLHVGDYRADPQIPTLHMQDFNLAVVVPAKGDPLGENAILGGPRSGDILGSSKGRGVLEVSQALLASVRDLTGADGTPIHAQLGSGSRARPVADSRHIVGQQHLIRAVVTADPEYLPVPWFTATKSGSDVNFAWALPANVGSFRRVVIRYADGSTSPATALDGTEVYTGDDTSASHTPSGFPASYSVFVAYSVTGADEDHAYSENERWTQRTVT